MSYTEYYSTAFTDVDASLDQIITLAGSLKGHVGTAKGHLDTLFAEKDNKLKSIHGDLESLQVKLEHTSAHNLEERARLERQIAEKEAEQKQKLVEVDAQIRATLDEKERIEREREAARGDAAGQRQKLELLLSDLEDDAHSYTRLRPSKPLLGGDDLKVIRQMFLSNAAAGTGKLSFAELKALIGKYESTLQEGALKKLFKLVEEDKKGRMSYITLVAVANDLTALVGDFRGIDLNGNNSLSRKEFREHYHKLGFNHRNTIDTIFRYADEDESDEVTFHEYVHLSLALLVLRILFTAADFDKTGSLSKEELRTVLNDAAIPSAAIAKFDHYFTVVDVDDSKNLNFNEFVMLVLAMFAED